MAEGDRPPRWTVAGLLLGVRLSYAMLPGCVAMAMALGTLSAQKGLTLAETLLMSGVLFAGASQLVALEIWTPRFTTTALVSVATIAAAVNLRYLLMTASLRPWLNAMPAWQVYPALMFTVDANWLVAMRYRAEGGKEPSVFLGSGLALWLCWVLGAIPGHLLGGMVADPKKFGLDLALPAFFAAMLVPLWKGPRWAIAWAVAGASAWLASIFIPGWWFIVVGAIAGSITGGFIDERE